MLLLQASILTACLENDEETGEYPYGHYEDDKMIGFVREVNMDEKFIVVNISEWEKRYERGPAMTSGGYSYKALITNKTIINHQNGTERTIDDMKIGQKLLINPPRGSEFEGKPAEITLLEMTYEEKYSELLSHVEDLNIVVLHEEGHPVSNDIWNISRNIKQNSVGREISYSKDYVVDYKAEFDIEQFPAILIFNQEKLVFKSYRVDEVYDFFNNLDE